MTDAPSQAVVFDHVSKSFGPKQVLNNVSLSVQAGEALCILGRSGTGKSVTLKLIISLLKPDTGKIYFSFTEEIDGKLKIATPINTIQYFIASCYLLGILV